MQSAQDKNTQTTLADARSSGERRVATLALLTIAGIILYVIIDVIAQLLPPHYNPIKQAESDLAVGPYGFVMTINFVLRGLLSLALIWALFLGVAKQGLSRPGLVFLGAWGVGALVLALFPTDLTGAAPTFHGKIHLLVATLAFICAAIGELLLSLKFASDEQVRSLRSPTLIIAILGIIAVLIVLALPFAPKLASDFGLYERIFIGLVLLWMLVVAFRLRSLPRS